MEKEESKRNECEGANGHLEILEISSNFVRRKRFIKMTNCYHMGQSRE